MWKSKCSLISILILDIVLIQNSCPWAYLRERGWSRLLGVSDAVSYGRWSRVFLLPAPPPPTKLWNAWLVWEMTDPGGAKGPEQMSSYKTQPPYTGTGHNADEQPPKAAFMVISPPLFTVPTHGFHCSGASHLHVHVRGIHHISGWHLQTMSPHSGSRAAQHNPLMTITLSENISKLG